MENCPKCKRIHERNLKEREELGDFYTAGWLKIMGQ